MDDVAALTAWLWPTNSVVKGYHRPSTAPPPVSLTIVLMAAF